MKLKVKASTKYDILIQKGISKNCGKIISKIIKPCKVLVVSDNFIPSQHYNDVIKDLTDFGYKTFTYLIPQGEQSKNITEYTNVLSFLADNNFSRKDLIIAVGGGVVGDLSAFVASTYMRGIKFINIPTTLLSCIDSSVGGKTGIDLPQGKNLVGTFYQPALVLCDSLLLNTLSDQVFKDGLGEGIKYGIMDKSVWDLLKQGVNDNIELFIYKCLKIKRDIVNKDEKESGLRQVLNLGHTFGHAIELLSNYTISHGIAVSKGIYLIAKYSEKINLINLETVNEIKNILKRYQIDYSCQYAFEEIKKVIGLDKKSNNGKINLILIEKIGKIIIKNTEISSINL